MQLDDETLKTKLKELAAPFPEQAIGKLPRITCKDCSDKKVQCQKHSKQKCNDCGNWITTQHIHLDYVGHAWVTDRLNEVDPLWNWEPVPNPAELGLPVTAGCFWIQLTVLGVSRYGVGDAEGKNGADAIKQMIGDALRNAAMRFGVALDLWKKDRHASTSTGSTADESAGSSLMPTEDEWKGMMDVLKALPDDVKPWVKTWREDREIPIKYGEINAAETLAILSFVDGLHAVFDHANGDGTVSPPPALVGDGVTDDTKAAQAQVNAGVRVNKTHLDTLTGLAGQLPKEGAQSQASLKKWRYEQGITGSPETWTVAQWEQVMAQAKTMLDNQPIDMEFRGFLGGRLANLGPEYEAVFQEHLDGLDNNPQKGKPWRQQMDRIPSSFDNEMRDTIDMLVQSHAATNPPAETEVLDGGEAF